MIEIRNLVKSYGAGKTAIHALKGVTLEARAGEVLLMMGPSGSGKTTLLSVIGCILQANSGSVKIEGRETVGLPESALPEFRLRHFGFIFQGFNLFPALTASENVELALHLKGERGSAARRRASVLLDRMGLGPRMNSLPADLSGGEKQRVAIARAVAGEPRILLADEPTAALDFESGQTVLDILRELARAQGRAVLIVTHDQRAVRYGDRIVRIEDGRILDDLNGAYRA